jgi:hypothetical protein
LLNTFFLQSTLNSICRSNLRRRGSTFNSILSTKSYLLCLGRELSSPAKATPTPPSPNMLCVSMVDSGFVEVFIFTLVLFKNWEFFFTTHET